MSSSLSQLDQRHAFHPYTSITGHAEQGPHLMARGNGIRVQDDQGNEYIDGMAGLWCVNAGYGRREIADAVRKQIETLSYYHSFMGLSNEPAVLLSERLAAATPGDLNRVFFCNSGSEANDTHVKIVWYYNNLRGRPEKKKVIARHGAYHGVTVAAASLSGLPALHQHFDLPLDTVKHTQRPCYYWDAPDGMSETEYSAYLAGELEALIEAEGPETIAAFIAEPVMGAGGVITPPEGYFEAIVPILKKHDVLFIADEVICGFGRLGSCFGSDVYGIEPDLMTLAKGLTSGYVPMAACVVSDRIYDTIAEHSEDIAAFAHGFTYTAHPVSAAAALANLDIIENEKLVENAAATGAYLHQQLNERVAGHALVGETRGLGLIAGVELVADKADKRAFDLSDGVAKRMYRVLLDEGLICRPVLNTMAFSPPLIVTKPEVDEMVSACARGLDRLADDLRGEGIWNG